MNWDVNSDKIFLIKVQGLPKDFAKLPFGRQIEFNTTLKTFKETSKSAHVGAKHSSTLKAVKEWIKMMGVTEYYAVWQKDSSYYKNDSVQVYYKGESV